MKNIIKEIELFFWEINKKILCLLLSFFGSIFMLLVKLFPKFDSYLSYDILSDRENIKLNVTGAEESITEAILSMFCAAFDIDPCDKYKIRGEDSIETFYQSWYEHYPVEVDDCEQGRFHAMLKALVNQEIPENILSANIYTIITWVANVRNNKPVSSDELQFVLQSYCFFLF